LEYEIRDGEVVYMDGGPVRIMVTELDVGPATEPTLRDLSEALIAVCGTDYGIHSPTWISRFTDMTRQAAAYRKGKVLLAGDAAHVHAPDGGQGLNTGVQDAVNLGWKLAQVVNRTSPESLLDTYHAERHPVAARVLRNTMAAIALRRADERTQALRDTMSELLGMEEPRNRFAAMLSGLDIHYDLDKGHPHTSAMETFLRLSQGPFRRRHECLLFFSWACATVGLSCESAPNAAIIQAAYERAAPDSRLRRDKGLRIIEATCDNDVNGRFQCQVSFVSEADPDQRLYLGIVSATQTGSGLDAHERVVQALRRAQSARRGVR
jgi:hypothetical protein